MVSRKSAYLVIGGALLLAACSKKTDSQSMAGAEATNATATTGSDSNAAAPDLQASRHSKRGNTDTRGAPSTSTTTK